MKSFHPVVAGLLTVVLLAPVAAQQHHVADRAAMDALVAERAAAEDSDRALILETLRHPEVRRAAERLDLPIAKAEDVVPTLEGDELRQAAVQARAAQEALAGGQSAISTTTIIIVLLVVILLVVALD